MADVIGMWCIKCQADVAAEMSPDNRQILCASCGSRIRSVPLLPTEDKTRKARELLERWSKTTWTDDEAVETDLGSEAAAAHSSGDKMSELRLDEPHSLRGGQQIRRAEPRQRPGEEKMQTETNRNLNKTRGVTRSPAAGRSGSPGQDFAYPSPHFSSEPFPPEAPAEGSSSSRLQAFWGQMLAYVGVLVLTIGAAFVLLGYFGGPQWQSYTPTGWLITTTGQMLLFLGVVTLVSGGMEQTAETVARRIDTLGQRMIRIEWAAENHGLKGPSLPAEQFATGGDETGEKPARSVKENEAAVAADEA